MADSLRALVSVESSEDAAKIDLSHHIEINSLLFEVSVPATSVMMAALGGGVSDIAEAAILRQLWRISDAEPHLSELDKGGRDLGVQVRESIREGVWSLYRALAGPSWQLAHDILSVIEPHSARLNYFTHELSFADRFPAA